MQGPVPLGWAGRYRNTCLGLEITLGLTLLLVQRQVASNSGIHLHRAARASGTEVMREEPLPNILRPRRHPPGGPPDPAGLNRADEAADLMPDIDLIPDPQAHPPFMFDVRDTYHLHLAALEFRRQVHLRELARQREKLVLAAMGLPLVAMLLKLLWSIFSGSTWWADDAHMSPWQGFVGGDW